MKYKITIKWLEQGLTEVVHCHNFNETEQQIQLIDENNVVELCCMKSAMQWFSIDMMKEGEN